MNDLNLAKDYLQENKLSVVIVKNGKIIEESNAKGIKPLFDIYKEKLYILKDASVADKVIGKAAAMILVHGKIKNLYAETISKKAIEVLEQNNIKYEYGRRVDSILNRDGSDLCPIEKLSINSDTVEELIDRIQEFLGGIQ